LKALLEKYIKLSIIFLEELILERSSIKILFFSLLFISKPMQAIA
jgi:hypothetical protein